MTDRTDDGVLIIERWYVEEAMTKPVWEEEWEADIYGIRRRTGGGDEVGPFTEFVFHMHGYYQGDDPETVARNRLGSAAPDMARVLLAILDDEEGARVDVKTIARIEAALRKAGVL